MTAQATIRPAGHETAALLAALASTVGPRHLLTDPTRTSPAPPGR